MNKLKPIFNSPATYPYTKSAAILVFVSAHNYTTLQSPFTTNPPSAELGCYGAVRVTDTDLVRGVA